MGICKKKIIVDPTKLQYGDIISLGSEMTGNNLSICGPRQPAECAASTTDSYNVTVRTDRKGFDRWRVEPALIGVKYGEYVKYGDKIYLQQMVGNRSLAVCGHTGGNCGVNVVVGIPRKSDYSDSVTWIIKEDKTLNATDAGSNDIIKHNEKVKIFNKKITLPLSACGDYLVNNAKYCGHNVSLNALYPMNRSTSSAKWRVAIIQKFK